MSLNFCWLQLTVQSFTSQATKNMFKGSSRNHFQLLRAKCGLIQNKIWDKWKGFHKHERHVNWNAFRDDVKITFLEKMLTENNFYDII